MKTLLNAFPQYAHQTAVVRANFDVPIENGQVGDTTRIEDAISTIKLLRQNGCKVILIAHAGRPDGDYKAEDSLRPVVPVLEQFLGESVAFAEYQSDFRQIHIPEGQIVLIDNLRFWPEEEANNFEFAEFLASLGQFYVNEAFAVCHRKHASIVSIPKYTTGFFGLGLQKEMEALARVRINPNRPLVVVIGGAKLETKMPLVNAFASLADTILVGGKIALEMNDRQVPSNVKIASLTPDGKDITKESALEFADIIMKAQTVVWNGTMGVFEEPEHQLGTKIVAEAINQTPAYTLMGGGDTETALTEFKLEEGIDHISTGGGAMLTYLVEGQLVGVDVIHA